ncbi:50S ribosomal protein L9 [Pajaroellobacter abortibovis]|uniref:Large ribosomal subunit protein bL9 n=1 Tax=Pajaroellobacter abortibovis TaxID=1882918 RepID=A0A1L6MXU3_9BACT|nr:50S ribosomal protein L9 [Pajaroellobacter abortibovis]APS00309.1 50S ribosomal protein L9 [Pajaroellobacter abortibovis]
MASMIQVVMQENFGKVWKSGDVVKVRPGFARNYLIPRKLAVLATEGAIHRIEHEKAVALARQEKIRQQAIALAEKIVGFNIRLARQVGEDSKLFGSITNKDVEVALKHHGFLIDKKKIHIEEPIRSLGLHVVRLKLHTEVIVPLQIEVVAK